MAEDLVATVTEAFRAELGVPCGPEDSFFGLGGDSLQAMSLLTRLNEAHGVSVPFAEAFLDSTPAAIARLMGELGAAPRPSRGSASAASRRSPRGWFPLAPSQEGLYRMNAVTQGAGLFNNVCVLRVVGDIDPDALVAAVGDTVRRQSALQLVFGEENGRPAQRFTDRLLSIETVDLRGAGEPALRRRVRRERLTGFDLHAGPPVRFVLTRLTDESWALVATFHHIVFDGMSRRVYMDDLAQAYCCRMGEAAPRPPLARDYAEFTEQRLRQGFAGVSVPLNHQLDGLFAAVNVQGLSVLPSFRKVRRGSLLRVA